MSEAGTTTVRHQHAVVNEPVSAGAQALGPPHNGQRWTGAGVIGRLSQVGTIMHGVRVERSFGERACR
jgi:hypothetical protein